MAIGIIVQARMGSTRFPGKILEQFYGGRTLIEILLEKLHKVEGCKVVVATSIDRSNDILETFLSARGELVYRGSENDVLERFIEAAEANGISGIVRVCSDNPFIDWRSVAALVDKAEYSDADYIGYRVNDMPSILTHFGFWGEYVVLDALKKVYSTTAAGTPAHEHVTFHIYKHPEEFKCEWIECPDFLQGRNDIRLTVDTSEDLKSAEEVYSDLTAVDADFSLQDVVSYIDRHVELKRLMLKRITENKK